MEKIIKNKNSAFSMALPRVTWALLPSLGFTLSAYFYYISSANGWVSYLTSTKLSTANLQPLSGVSKLKPA